MQPHGQVQFELVAVLPGSPNFQITAGIRPRRNRLVVDFQRATTGGPGRDAKIDSGWHGLRGFDGERGAGLFGKTRFLAQR